MSRPAPFRIPFTHLDSVSLEALWYGCVVLINNPVRSSLINFAKSI